MRPVYVLGSVALVFAALVAHATTIHVPVDQPTIQLGVEAAAAGDTVLVACGTYYERDIAMKSGVVLRSETGAPDCVTIDAEGQSRVFFCQDVTSATVIEGVTITGGSVLGEYPDNVGGGMWCYDASPTLTNVRFTDNVADSQGGGLSCRYESHPVLTDVLFDGNSARSGGGLHCVGGAHPSLSNVVFVGNQADYGGGMYCFESSPTLTNTTFSENSADAGGGIYCSHWATPTISKSIIAFSTTGPAIECFGRGVPDVSQSIIFGNEDGDSICSDLGDNLIRDPRFCDLYSGDLSLCSNSPCLPENNTWDVLVGAFPSGCGSCDAPVEHLTWGTLKALFR